MMRVIAKLCHEARDGLRTAERVDVGQYCVEFAGVEMRAVLRQVQVSKQVSRVLTQEHPLE